MKVLLSLFVLSSILYAHIITPEMLEELDKRIAKNDQDAMALRQRAYCYNHMGKLKEAAADLEKVRSLIPEGQIDYYLNIQLAVFYYKAEEFDKALNVYEETITEDFWQKNEKNNVIQIAVWTRADIYFRKGDYLLAWQDVKKLEKYLPGLTILVKAGEISEKANKWEDAVEFYTRAVLEYPSASSEEWLCHAINLHLKLKQYDTAKKLVDALQQKLGEDPLAYYYRGLLQQHYLQEPEKAQQDYQEALKHAAVFFEDENIVEGCFWQARVYLAMGELQKALECTTKAIAENNELPVFFQLRGLIYDQLKQPQEAQKAREIAQKLQDENKGDWIKMYQMTIP